MWASGGLSLSDLAADHLKNTANTFSFLSEKKENFKDHRITPDENSQKPKPEASKEIQFEEFNDFFDDDDDFDFESSLEIGDSLDNSQTGSERVSLSSFGCVICRELETTEKRTVVISHTAASLKYANQLKDIGSTPRNPYKIFPKMQCHDIVSYDFSDPSPDDIIIERQKAAL